MNLIGRRNFLAGLGLGASALMLAPFFRHLLARAQGQESSARRLVMMTSMNGLGHLDEQRWVPSGPTLTIDTLAPSHAPLAAWASDMLIVDNLYNPYNPGQHNNGWATLSVRGVNPPRRPTIQSHEVWPDPTGISIDVLAGQELSDGLAHDRIGWYADIPLWSSDASRNRVASFGNTRTAFTQVFGGFDPTASDDELEYRALRGQSVLDFAMEDLDRMRGRLAPSERVLLEQYEDSIRTLEERAMTAAPRATCSVPAAPEGLNAGEHNGVYSRAYVETMMELHIVALECHLTNVMAFNPVPSRRHYGEILGIGVHAHSMSHGDASANLVRLDQFNAGLLAQVITRLEASAEGSGTMADNTLFCWYDENGGRHHSHGNWHKDHPLILIGNMHGHFRTGRHVRYAQDDHAVSDGFVSMLQSLGVDTNSFGDPSICRGALGELRA